MTRRGTLVAVAYYAPPAVGVASHRLAGMVRHLRALGWDMVVVAPEAVHYHRGASEEIEGARVVRVPNPEPSRWLRTLGRVGRATRGEEPGAVASLDPVDVGSVGAFARRLAHDWLYVPDAQFPWIGPAARAARRVVEETPGPVVLFSTSVPYSAHFAARRVQEKTGVPWVAEYRDPWSAAPRLLERRPALRQLIDRRLDESLIRAASRVVVTSDATRDLFLDTFPGLTRPDIAVIRNGWRERRPDDAPDPDSPLVLLYTGTLLRWTWAVPLLRAVREVASEHPVRLRVLGSQEPWRRAAGEVGGLDDVLELLGMVPGEEISGHLAASSALVLLRPDEELGLYVAGKAYEYLGSRRPILGWVPEGTEMTGLLRRHGDLRRVGEGSAEAFSHVIRALLAEHREGTLQGPRVEWTVVEPLSREAQVARLDALLLELVG